MYGRQLLTSTLVWLMQRLAPFSAGQCSTSVLQDRTVDLVMKDYWDRSDFTLLLVCSTNSVDGNPNTSHVYQE